jgi:RNA-binding protein 16
MPKSSRGKHGVRKTSVPSVTGQSYTTAETFLTNLGFLYLFTTTDTSTESDNLKIYSQGLSSGTVVPLGTQIPMQYYVFTGPFFPPFFPYFPPFFPFFPFFPYFPPFFPYFPPFFPYFPPFFPFFPFFPYFPPFFPYFPPFFPYFPPFFPPAFGPYFVRCVDGDTLILTSNGPKKARDIKIEDVLLTVNLESLTEESNATPLQINVQDLQLNNLVHTKVTNVIASNKVERVYFNNDKTAQFTETHPIFVKRNNEYRVVEAGTVQEGDFLITINPDELSENLDINKVISETVVTKVNKNILNLEKDVYTFSCDPYNWYFAGNILTHNK